MSKLSSLDLILADICSSLESTDSSAAILSPEMAVQYNLTNLTITSPHNNADAESYIRDLCTVTGVSIDLDEKATPLQLVQHYLSGVCVFIICLFGIIGNSLAVKVLVRKQESENSGSVYLTALTIADTLFLLCVIFLCMKDLLSMKMSIALSAYSGYMFPIVHPLANIFHSTSIWLMLGCTVNKYIMVCHPMSASRFCDHKRAIKVVVAIYIFGIIYNIPRFFEYETEVLPHSFRDKIYAYAKHTELGASKQYLRAVHFWLYLFCMFLIPCLSLIILNILLLRQVTKSRNSGRRISLVTVNYNSGTFMLVAIVFVFLVCQLPALIIKTIFTSEPEKFLNPEMDFDYLNIIQEVTNFLVILNSAINILVYYSFSRHFRTAFAKSFWPKACSETKQMISEFTQRLSFSRKSSVMGESILSKSRNSEISLSAGVTSNGRPSNDTMKGQTGYGTYTPVATFAPLWEEMDLENTYQGDAKAEELVSLNDLNNSGSDLNCSESNNSGIWIEDD